MSNNVVRVSDVKKEKVGWLWKPYIPKGKITIIEGDPGSGKSWICLTLAALISSGKSFPGNRKKQKESPVLYLSAEDSVGDTIRSRLEAAGANLSNVFSVVGGGDVYTIDKLVESIYEKTKNYPAIIIIDPMQAYFERIHSVRKTRPLLSRLIDIAETKDISILIVRHLTKGTGGKAIYRGMGSIDFSAAVRSILSVGLSPSYPEFRILAHTKSSLGKNGPSIGFKIKEGKIEWAGEVDVSPADLLGADITSEAWSAIQEAKNFLLDVLNDGPVPARVVRDEASELGISMRTLRRARKALGVYAKRESLPGQPRGTGRWLLFKGAKESKGAI